MGTVTKAIKKEITETVEFKHIHYYLARKKTDILHKIADIKSAKDWIREVWVNDDNGRKYYSNKSQFAACLVGHGEELAEVMDALKRTNMIENKMERQIYISRASDAFEFLTRRYGIPAVASAIREETVHVLDARACRSERWHRTKK